MSGVLINFIYHLDLSNIYYVKEGLLKESQTLRNIRSTTDE